MIIRPYRSKPPKLQRCHVTHAYSVWFNLSLRVKRGNLVVMRCFVTADCPMREIAIRHRRTTLLAMTIE